MENTIIFTPYPPIHLPGWIPSGTVFPGMYSSVYNMWQESHMSPSSVGSSRYPKVPKNAIQHQNKPFKHMYSPDEWLEMSLNLWELFEHTLYRLPRPYIDSSTCQTSDTTLEHLWALLEAIVLYIKLASSGVSIQPVCPSTHTANWMTREAHYLLDIVLWAQSFPILLLYTVTFSPFYHLDTFS